jgi:hypothetical protein
MDFTHKDLRKFTSDSRKLILKVQEAGWRGDRIARHGAVLLAPDGQPFRVCIPRSVNGRLLNNTMAPFKRWVLQQSELPTTTTEEVDVPTCAECGKRFDRKQQVAVHHSMVHDLKPCPACGRKMNASNLARHVASAHKPYEIDNEAAPVDIEAEPVTLAGIEIPPPPPEPFVFNVLQSANKWAADKIAANAAAATAEEQLEAIRLIVSPELEVARKRIVQLEEQLAAAQLEHERELQECQAKLDLIRGLVDSR